MHPGRATPAAPPADAAVAIGLEPFRGRRWPAALGAIVTALMVAGLARELLNDGLAGLARSAPASPLFYLFFAGLYLSLPVADFLIFRHLWGIPWTGLAATVKKRVANEVILSYSGEAYFYSWARANARMVAAPFGAVKDVSILSAMAGNAATLLLMAASVPLAGALLPPGMLGAAGWSALLVAGTSAPFFLFRRRVFSLNGHELRWIFQAHFLRIAAGALLIGLAWSAAMPDMGIGIWLLLAAGRLLVSRLPLVPNKDLLFANLAVAVIGPGERLSELIAFTGALFLLAHAAFLMLFGVAALARRGRA